MQGSKTIQSALISVYHKEGLDQIVEQLKKQNVTLYSTGGTQKYLEDMGCDVVTVESLTDYPSILGGRVKTLHPKIFGGILGRLYLEDDQRQMAEYGIPAFDLVVVDLYPFDETVANAGSHEDIIEKIDIGGISLIRAAAKNYKEVTVIPSKAEYGDLLHILENQNGSTTLDDRKALAAKAFGISNQYDGSIHNYMSGNNPSTLNMPAGKALRYGENPHQTAEVVGNIDKVIEQLHGKALSYNNLLDIDAAIQTLSDFEETTFAILKHNNACGLASRANLSEAYQAALAGDPVSAFGGVLITNVELDLETATQVHELFCEVVIAPSFQAEALELLKGKKNRIILKWSKKAMPKQIIRSILNGYLVQDRDTKMEGIADLETATKKSPSDSELSDLIFANKAAKHLKSNTIALVKNKQLVGMGCGQTSRVDALKQAITKAKAFGFDLNGAVMASDAFFPFADCVEIAHDAGINAVIQPGGSIRDKDSIEYCDAQEMSMVLTGTRHFKH